MSIENNLERIASALESIANSVAPVGDPIPVGEPLAQRVWAPRETAPVAEPVAEPAPAPAPVAEPAPAPVAEPAPAPVAEPVAEPVAAMTVEELNTALVAEFKRLGGREGIDAEIAKLGASSISEVDASQYAGLLNAVKAIQP
jgi:pyruvate/2-oxoglutarate dehydrogenase complex dihydrolipoamide acyltransferase (E2) component